MVSDALLQIGEDDYTVKVCRALFGAVPGAAPFVVYRNFGGAVARLDPSMPPNAVVGAAQHAEQPEAERALWVAEALDRADMGLAAFAGLKNVLSLFTGARSSAARTFESDREQAADAGVKLLGIAYMGAKLFPDAPAACATRFASLPAGREMLVYFAAVEVVLPFLDNVAGATGSVFDRLLGLASSDSRARFGRVVGLEAAGESRSILEGFRGPIEQYLGVATTHVGPIAASLKSFLPSALGAADSLTGVAASTLDALPIWRFLGARLVAEACAARGLGAA
jgi:hypothetical protein